MRKDKKGNDGIDFEHKMCKLLKENGYHNVQTTKTSGDYGVDILATKRGVKYAIQCKDYSNKVGVSAVQEAASGCNYYDYDQAVVLTNNEFTKNAEELARKTNVLLWDKKWIDSHRHKVQLSSAWTFIMLLITLSCIIGEDENKIVYTVGCLSVWYGILNFIFLIQNIILNIKSFFYRSKIYSDIKIYAFSLWTSFIVVLMCLAIPNAKENISFMIRWSIIWCVSVLLYWGISKLLSIMKIKIIKRKVNKLNKELDNIGEEISQVTKKLKISYDLQREIDRANELADIVNTTTNREEFYKGVSEIKTILKHLITYEGIVDFESLPSEDLKRLEANEKEQEILLEKRIQDKNMNHYDKIKL